MFNFVFLKIISPSDQRKFSQPSVNYCNFHLHLQRVQQEYVAMVELCMTDCHSKLTNFVNYSNSLCRKTDLNSAKDTNEILAEVQEPTLQ